MGNGTAEESNPTPTTLPRSHAHEHDRAPRAEVAAVRWVPPPHEHDRAAPARLLHVLTVSHLPGVLVLLEVGVGTRDQ